MGPQSTDRAMSRSSGMTKIGPIKERTIWDHEVLIEQN